MATQRVGGSSEAKKNGGVKGNEASEESAVKKDRQLKKAKVLKEQQRQNAKFRWTLVAVLLIVMAVGLYYYFWHYQATDLPKSRRKTQSQSSTSKPSREKPKTGKTEKQKPPNHKQQKMKKENSKGKADSKSAIETDRKERLEQVKRLNQRVLHQPIPGSDPDRPHALDIITGDNLLADGKYQEALERFNAILSQFPQSPRAQLGKGLTLSRMAREKRSNKLMDTAIEFFRKVGVESIISSDAIKVAALVPMVDYAQERGQIKLAIQGMEKLVELRDEEMVYANQLGVLYLKQGNTKKAKAQFKKSVDNFEENHFAKAQLGSILHLERHYEQALPLMMDGIRLDKDVRRSGYIYNYAGDALNRLNRSQEAFALYGEAVALGLFPSVWQRPLLNEPGLKALEWWSVDATGYKTDVSRIEKKMDIITREALAIFDAEKMAFTAGKQEAPHYVLFSKGKKNLENCRKTPKTCALLETFPEAVGCKHGTIKFSSIPPRTHIAPHVGGTNTKLQVLVGLDMDSEGGIRIRIAEDTKVLGRGQIGVIDESFEKEVWYIGEVPAVYLTVDVWHPNLSELRKRQLGSL